MSQFVFDATQVQPDAGRQPPIPKGVYRAIMVNSEIKPTSNGSGMYIAAEFKVLGGAYDGRSIYSNFNIQNQSAKAQEIGQRQFSAVCHATGILHVQDTAQLHNRPLNISVKIEAGGLKADGTGNYDDRNEVVGYAKDTNVTTVQPFNMPPPAVQEAPVPSQAPYMGQPTQPAPVMQPVQPAPQQWAQNPAPVAQPWAQPEQVGAPVQTELPMEFQQPTPQPAWAGANPVQPAAPNPQAAPPAAQATPGAPPPWAQAPVK